MSVEDLTQKHNVNKQISKIFIREKVLTYLVMDLILVQKNNSLIKILLTKQIPEEGYGNWEDRLETGMVASTDL